MNGVGASMNPLLDCSEFVLYVARKFIRGESQDGDVFKTEIDESLALFKERAQAKKLPEMAIKETEYALTAFIDEMVLNSKVTWKKEWSKSTLQQEYFQAYTSGEGFFNRLNELRKSPSANQFILEMYCLCLEFGFKGKYVLQADQAARLELIVGLKSQLALVKEPMVDYLIGHNLIEEAVECTKSTKKWWDRVSNTAMILGSLIISGLVFVFAHWPLGV